jgi:hypothetical protein
MNVANQMRCFFFEHDSLMKHWHNQEQRIVTAEALTILPLIVPTFRSFNQTTSQRGRCS